MFVIWLVKDEDIRQTKLKKNMWNSLGLIIWRSICFFQSKTDLPVLVLNMIDVIFGRMRDLWRYFLTKQYNVRLNHVVKYFHYMESATWVMDSPWQSI